MQREEGNDQADQYKNCQIVSQAAHKHGQSQQYGIQYEKGTSSQPIGQGFVPGENSHKPVTDQIGQGNGG